MLKYLFLFVAFPGVAQVFYGQAGPLSDVQPVHKVDSFKIEVQGLPSAIDGSFGLAKVCFDMVHPKVSDLKIELISPDGTGIWLSNRNGGDEGSGYYGTCVRAGGHSGYIHRAAAPFTGEFIPDGRMEFLNNRQNPNGTWHLIVQDLKGGNQGRLSALSLTFEKNPVPFPDKEPCTLADGSPCKCPDGTENCELLPDLVILPSYTDGQIREYPYNDPVYPGQLRFAVAIANTGDGPIETFGKNLWYCNKERVADSSYICPDGSHARQQVVQRIYSKKGNILTFEDREAGTNYFEDLPGHHHYHNDDWVEFRLVKEKGKRRSLIAKVAMGRKISFCLFDSGICHESTGLCQVDGINHGPHTLPNYGLGSYVDCNTPGARTGISVGAYDAYGMHFEGQHIDLPKGLEDGDYVLELEVDPMGKYREKNKKNNVLRVPVKIGSQRASH